ncbi:MAG: ABC transporter permease [Pirellulales bacterium]
MTSETYFEIVWQQFRKNRAAYWSLWLFAGIFLLAILAPLLGSDVPFVFRDGDKTLYPWLVALFNPDEHVDYAFNMALLGLPAYAVVAVLGNRWAKRRGIPGRVRLAGVLAGYLALTVVLCGFFAIPGIRPNNKYRTRRFVAEELASSGQKHGIYAPIPFGALEQDISSRFKRPMYRKPRDTWQEANDGFVHLLGTDDIGRDVMVQMLYGTRLSMTIGFLAVSIYLTIGIILGAIAGYYGGWHDMLISRLVEIVLLFPSFFLILTLVGLMGPSIYIIMFVIGITGWPTIARLIRGEVLKQRAIDYVTAARALGTSHRRVVFRHILPNAISPALVAAPFGIAGAIITEAGLSLLGFGVRPPTPSWGTLLRLASYNYNYWWLVVVPSLAIFVTVTVFNLVGSGMRDALDPRLRR